MHQESVPWLKMCDNLNPLPEASAMYSAKPEHLE